MAYLCFSLSFVFLVATTLCFKANDQNRHAIDRAVGGQQIPERMKPYYTADDLNRFIEVAKSNRAGRGNALDLYIRPTLLWIDIGFAVFCAAFATFFWLGVSELLQNHSPLRPLFSFLIAMSVTYGVADVAEDLWLVKLFSQDHKVTTFEGAVACGFTEIKLVTIVLSVVGGIAFLGLNRTISNRPPPAQPTV